LLKTRLPRFPPIGKAVHGPLHSHHCVAAWVSFKIVLFRVQLVHAESGLSHWHRLVGGLRGVLPCATLIRSRDFSFLQVLRLWKTFGSCNALMQLAALLIHVRNVELATCLIYLRAGPSSLLCRGACRVMRPRRWKLARGRVIGVGVQVVRKRRHPAVACADLIG
jgi:hypothetical protein